MIYAIDFDGTIVSNRFPKIGTLNMKAYCFIRKLQERGDKWILYTMREGIYLEEAVLFLKNIHLKPDAVNDNLPEMCDFYKNNPRKVFADVYIDDHNAGGLVFADAKQCYMTENEEASALKIVLREYESALEKHPKFAMTMHQAVSLIAEEVGELAQQVNNGFRMDWQKRWITEAAHVAVTAIRTIEFIKERAEE